MSTRLQVLLDDEELAEIKAIARRQRMTVAEWVRQALRSARKREPRAASEQKRQAIRHAALHAFPTADIGDMLAEIDRGVGGG
jgi:hypothetical protein